MLHSIVQATELPFPEHEKRVWHGIKMGAHLSRCMWIS